MAAFAVTLAIVDPGNPTVGEFEFAGSERRAAEMMAEWGAGGRDLARLSLWLDFGFLLSYGSFFLLAGLATRDFARARGLRLLAAVGLVAPFCAAIAAGFDAVENVNLLLVLGGHGGSVSPVLATVCASIKWVLILIAIAYVLWGLAERLLLRVRADRGS